jgi:hypothetical protein
MAIFARSKDCLLEIVDIELLPEAVYEAVELCELSSYNGRTHAPWVHCDCIHTLLLSTMSPVPMLL